MSCSKKSTINWLKDKKLMTNNRMSKKNMQIAENKLRQTALDKFKILPEMMNHNNALSRSKNGKINYYMPFFEWVDMKNRGNDVMSSRWNIADDITDQVPLGDNYGEIVQYKENQLEEIEKRKHKLYNEDSIESRAELKIVQVREQKLKDQLTMLSNNEIDYMFAAILDDLKDIEAALISSNIHDVHPVKRNLEFYTEIGKTLEKHEDYNEVSGKIAELNNIYSKLLGDKTLSLIEDSEAVQEALKDANTNQKTLDRIGKNKLTIEDTLAVDKDITEANQYFLGINVSSTGDTVIPGLIYKTYRDTIYDKTTKVQNKVDRLNSFRKKTGYKGMDVFELYEDGSKTGDLLNLTTKKWSKALIARKILISNFWKSFKDDTSDTKPAYNKIITWHKKNTEIVDFTKLSIVKKIYSAMPEYSSYFTYNDKVMEEYENKLRKQLSTKYDSTIKEVINKLQKYQDLKTDLQGDTKERNLAANNVWEFNKKYKEGTPSSNIYKYQAINRRVYFSGFKDLVFFPKSKVVQQVQTPNGIKYNKVNSEFYSDEFQEMLKDPNKKELWEIFKDMGDYINAVYGVPDNGRISYPKIRQDYMEILIEDFQTIRANKAIFGVLGKMFTDTAQAYKQMFFESEGDNSNIKGVISNRSDTSKKEIRNKQIAYMLQNMSKEEAKKKATSEVLENYSTDLDIMYKAALIEAALHDARVETEPMAQSLLNYYKTIQYEHRGEMKDRVRGAKRLEHFISKSIQNKNTAHIGEKGIQGADISRFKWVRGLSKIFRKMPTKWGKRQINEDSFKYTTPAEKGILESFKQVRKNGVAGEFLINDVIGDQKYTLQRIEETPGNWVYNADNEIVSQEKFENALEIYIEEKINSIGLGFSVAGLTDGMIGTIVLAKLGLAPASGVFNRVEGKISALLMDATGNYWSTGNIDIANDFMAWTNLLDMFDDIKDITNNTISKTKLSNITNGFTKKEKGRVQELRIFRSLIKQLGVLQDKKNEQQRNVADSKFTFRKINLFAPAVELPEFKNQGAITSAIMMDTYLEDSNGDRLKDEKGKDIPLFDKKTQTFPALYLVDGVLKVKEEFKDKFTFDSKVMKDLVTTVENAVSHSQGNYNAHDIMMLKGNAIGRALMVLITWFPSHLHQRWSTATTGKELNLDVVAGQEAKEGRYIVGAKASPVNTALFLATALGITSAGLGMLGFLGGGVISTIIYFGYIKKIFKKESVKKDAQTAKEMAEFLKSIMIEFINFPSKIGSSFWVLRKMRVYKGRNDSFKKIMTKEEAGAMVAMTRELGVMLSVLSVKLAVGALFWNDDDDEESPQRMRYNKVQNQLSRTINTLAAYLNPYNLYKDHSRLIFISQLEETVKLMDHVLQGEWEDANKSLWKLSAVPSIITKQAVEGIAPWEDKMNYDDLNDLTGITGPLKWTSDLVKEWGTDGEYQNKKEYRKHRDEMRSTFKDEYMGLAKGKTAVLTIILDSLLDTEIGDKSSDDTYKKALDNILKTGKASKKASKSNKNKTRKKLEKLKLSEKQITKIMYKMYPMYGK